MGISAGAAALISAVIGAGSAAYSASEQRKSQARAQEEARRAEMEARAIQASQKPLEESATLETDTGVNANVLNQLGLMQDPADLSKRKKATTGLGTTTSGAGLGTSAITSSLGFGG